jgi:hypothetical protein
VKKLTYVGPLGDGVDVPGLGDVAPGSPVDVPDDLAAGLLDQPSNWQAVTTTTKSSKEEQS